MLTAIRLSAGIAAFTRAECEPDHGGKVSTNRRDEGAFSGKRLSPGAFAGSWRVLAASVAIVLTACGDRGNADVETAAQPHPSSPMLPGTRADLRQDAGHAPSGPLAQGFDTAHGQFEAPASSPLLPPVMHSAD